MPIRFLIASFLILLGGVLSVPAALAIWQEREIQDEDNFIETTNEVFENEDVQVLLATRLTDAIIQRTELSGLIAEGLMEVEERAGERAPVGLLLLQEPLTQLARDRIYALCLRLLEEAPLAEVRETALRTVHRALMAIVKEDVPFIEQNDGQVVLNLRPLVVRVVTELAGERGEEALQEIDIPEDAGIIVLTEEQEHPWLWRAVRFVDDINPVVPIIAGIVFLVGIAVAKNRRRAVMATGATLAVVAGLSLLALAAPVKELATGWPPTPEGRDAASEVYDILLDSFRMQQLFIVVFGLALVGGGAVAGDRRLIESIRRSGRQGESGAFNGVAFVRERAVVLRLGGLALAGILLILLPEPGLRTVLTIVGLLALYLGAIHVLASNSEWAARVRARIGEGLWGSVDIPVESRSGFVGWVATHAGLLRLIGILVAACFVLFVWDLSLRGFILMSAAELLYLAGIEWAVASTSRSPNDETSAL